MPRHHVERRSPHPPDKLYALASDVRTYPEFVPWIRSMRVWNERETSETSRSLDAEATVGFKLFSGTFGSHVTFDDARHEIATRLISGPFKRLSNTWRFVPEGEGSRILFDIDFEFRSRLLQMLLDANFDYAVGRLIGCFEARADALYRAGSSSGASVSQTR